MTTSAFGVELGKGLRFGRPAKKAAESAAVHLDFKPIKPGVKPVGPGSLRRRMDPSAHETQLAADRRGDVGKSAFGVDGVLCKAEQRPATGGRLAAGAVFPGWHAAAAGKKGKKLRAAGHELGGGLVGGILVPGVGAIPGAAIGTHYAQKKGYYKPQVAKSAFNVDRVVVEKLGPPKVRMQAITATTDEGNRRVEHKPDTIDTRYRGKSLILRRPKYQAVAHPAGIRTDTPGLAGATFHPHLRVGRAAATSIEQAHHSKAKTVSVDGTRYRHVTKSAFGVNKGVDVPHVPTVAGQPGPVLPAAKVRPARKLDAAIAATRGTAS